MASQPDRGTLVKAVDPELAANLVRWRHHLHRFPETGFNEKKTSDYVANVLEALGLQVHRGIGGTGLVASMTVGSGKGVIALRVDMDALAMPETAQGRDHVSQHTGCMHGCGHDGHMAMVLGAAHLLKMRPDFDGTVRFIFQPAEEHGRGANAMIQDGLFERFPVDEIYGAHSIPGMPVGQIATRVGGIMASEDNFVIRIQGRGGHAARPHMAADPLVAAAEIILALQAIVARSVDPADSAVVSCTEIHSDGIRNAIPSNGGQCDCSGGPLVHNGLPALHIGASTSVQLGSPSAQRGPHAIEQCRLACQLGRNQPMQFEASLVQQCRLLRRVRGARARVARMRSPSTARPSIADGGRVICAEEGIGFTVRILGRHPLHL